MIVEPAVPSRGVFWTPGRVYATYRLLLAGALLGTFLVSWPTPVVGGRDPGLFLAGAIAFVLLALGATLWMRVLTRRFPNWGSLPAVIVDVVMLTVLMHASGGISSSLGVLLVVTVAAGGILLPGRGGLFIAALATMAVMFEQFWFSIQESRPNPLHLTESALLGVSFFVTALIISLIVQRLVRSEALAESRQRAIHQLEALNRKIVQRMRTGVLVINEGGQVLLANSAARQFFGTDVEGRALPEPLRERFVQWRAQPERPRSSLDLGPAAPAVMVGFASLEGDEEALTLVFMEDERQLVQQAQQLKLSSLGRMSATLAHEIRNPLSAIHHAAELLEDGHRNPEDARLVEIIRSHVRRVNRIIDDMLNLSRRPASVARRFELGAAVRDFLDRHHNPAVDRDRVRLALPPEPVEVRFDPQQLEQVLDNLVSNAFRHGGRDVEVTLSVGMEARFELPWLRVRDTGPGLSPDVRAQLFEPFFTTSTQGTGLGLFVCRELCEANQARLDVEDIERGTSFVITFAHPDRVFL